VLVPLGIAIMAVALSAVLVWNATRSAKVALVKSPMMRLPVLVNVQLEGMFTLLLASWIMALPAG
jgi:hypothetical protein